MPDTADHIRRYDCSTADEFLDRISPRNDLFYDFGPGAFMFRGHADARFQLVPAAFRLGSWMRAQALLHFTLPIDQSPPLLRLLAKEGVSGTSLFPGYVGVVAGLQEEQFWRTGTASAQPK